MLPALLLAALPLQDTAPERTVPDLAPIQAVVEELYRAICYVPGGQPDWEEMAAVFHPEARLVLAWPAGTEPRVQTVPDFVAEYRQALASPQARASGFLEGPTRLEIMRFGNIAQVDAVFEAFMPPDAARAVRRGIDSFQLVQVGTEWKVLTLVSAIELPTRALGEAVPMRQVVELSLRGEAVELDDATGTLEEMEEIVEEEIVEEPILENEELVEEEEPQQALATAPGQDVAGGLTARRWWIPSPESLFSSIFPALHADHRS